MHSGARSGDCDLLLCRKKMASCPAALGGARGVEGTREDACCPPQRPHLWLRQAELWGSSKAPREWWPARRRMGHAGSFRSTPYSTNREAEWKGRK